MDASESRKRLEDDPELARSLREALERNAAADEISGILEGAGVDTETIEAFLAEYQHKRGDAIGTQELDDEELDHVAGGKNCSLTDWCELNASNCSLATACNKDYSCHFDYKV